ncbi:MAG: YebC/PmpR family DNA-binding transcriptional regulator [Candidatus Omnitrophota bacterium]
MSGHSKWATIKHKKAATDAKRGALFTKLTKEITAAAKAGGGDSETNIRLRTAVLRAKSMNMPSANIDNALKKGTGEIPGIVYEEVVFDAYGPGGVAILIEGLTDNKNRTTAEIRNILSKKNGNMAGAGSTAWMFSSKGMITVKKSDISEEELMEVALEAGANDISSEGDLYEVTSEVSAFPAVKEALEAKKIPIETAEITKVPSSTVKLVGNDAKQLLALMSALEDHEDIQAVHANFDIPDEEMDKIAE